MKATVMLSLEYGAGSCKARYGREAVVRLLLDAGTGINADCGTYSMALQNAWKGGHEAVVRLLLANDVDINVDDGTDGTILHSTAAAGHGAIVGLLAKTGAGINAGPRCFGLRSYKT